MKGISFHLEDYDKAAIVGINGAGKTTLLRIIMKELSADEGVISFAKDKTVGYLAQNQDTQSTKTIYDELLSVKGHLIEIEQKMRETELAMKNASEEALADYMNQYTLLTHKFESENGYAYKSELVGVLKGLGFTEKEFSQEINTLSGGQKTRVALGKLLLTKPDLIILDEPTNHLDMSSIKWLETYLLNYKGAVLIVSHDRYFLDRIASKIIEIDQTKATVFQGNYSDYAAKKEILRRAAINAYEKNRLEIEHQKQVIEKLKSFNREKSIKRAESREKMLDKMEVLEKPAEDHSDMKLKLEPKYTSGKDVLSVSNLTMSYPDKPLFADLSFELHRGEHVAIIGDNGTGKTTILKILNELVVPLSGEINLGSQVSIGYYDQEHHVLHEQKTLFEEISDAYPDLTNTEIRNTLAAFLFTGEDVFKKISSLSGGEKGRVSLAKLMLSKSNFLILDEPTNHLDIMSKEILEDALNAYTGTVLYVSHDRYFINKTAHRILELSAHNLQNYLGNYDYYLEKKEQITPQAFASSDSLSSASKTETENKLDWKLQKEEQAKKRKLENDFKKCEEEIERLEAEKSALEEEMALPEVCRDVARLQQLNKAIQEHDSRLSDLYSKWDELSEQI